MGVEADVQSLAPDALIELFTLDATNTPGGAISHFHAGTNKLRQSVVWNGETYTAWPIQVNGFELSTQGKIARPTMQIANISGTIGAMARDFGDLLGAKVIRHRTFAKYLDAENFPDGNPTADPNMGLPDDLFYVNQKSSEDRNIIEFTLTAMFDVEGVRVPARLVITTCPWKYRGGECTYAGGPVADVNDTATADPTKDQCGKRLASCKLRFGANGVLPFGGWPSAGLLK